MMTSDAHRSRYHLRRILPVSAGKNLICSERGMIDRASPAAFASEITLERLGILSNVMEHANKAPHRTFAKCRCIGSRALRRPEQMLSEQLYMPIVTQMRQICHETISHH